MKAVPAPACVPVCILAVAALSLAGCAQDRHVYPSLAPRAVERMGFAEPVVTIPKAQPDSALDAQIGGISERLRKVAAGFAADARVAAAAADRARGAKAGSDAWLDAQTALAQLDDWQAQSNSLLADVDALISARATQLLPAYPALDGLRETVADEAQKQARTIADLQLRLAPA